MREPIRSAFAWLELLLALTVVVLLVQVFAAVPSGMLQAMDIRNWSRTMWFSTNCLAALALLTMRFGPDVYGGWREQWKRTAADRQKQQKRRELKDHREMLERINEGRKRRMY